MMVSNVGSAAYGAYNNPQSLQAVSGTQQQVPAVQTLNQQNEETAQAQNRVQNEQPVEVDISNRARNELETEKQQQVLGSGAVQAAQGTPANQINFLV